MLNEAYSNKALNYLKSIYFTFEWTPITIIRESLSTFARISGWRYISTHLSMQLAALSIGNVVSYNLDRIFAEKFADIEEDFQNLSKYGNKNITSSTNEHWVSFQGKNLEIIPYIGYYTFSLGINYFINSYFSSRLSHRLEDDLNNKKFSKQIGYGLSHKMESDIISRNIAIDAANVTKKGIDTITNSYTAAQNALYSLVELLSFSRWINIYKWIKVPDLIAASAVYGYATQFISGYLSDIKNKYNNQLIELSIKRDVIKVHDANNIKTITERGGEEYTKQRYKKLDNEIRNIENKSLIVSSGEYIWKYSHRFINYIFKHVIIGQRLHDQTLAHENRGIVVNAIDKTGPFFAWNEQNSDLITESKAVLGRVNKFLDNEAELLKKPQSLVYNRHNENYLVIEDFWLKIGKDRLLVHIPSYKFLMGKRYLLTGDSGNGKSTLLAKIAGITHTGEINASGSITEPQLKNKEFKKSMLAQADYFPKYTTLFEAICYPDLPPENPSEQNQLKEKIISLLKETNIDNVINEYEYGKENIKNTINSTSIIGLLDTVEDWDTRLSGGQKKKIQVISQIIKNPDILILDEAFTGLDKNSIAMLHNILIKYLPQTMMLVVDHHGVDNDKLSGHDFCQKHLHFADHKVQEVSCKIR